MSESILFIVTTLVTYIVGIFAKKYKYINSKIIPIQNLIVGIIMAIIYYMISKDFSLSILSSGLFAGGAYDIINNLKKISGGDNMIYPIENINITGGYTSSHQALDLGWTNTTTEELLACSDGVVENVYTITTGGNTILIDYENGYKSYFMHCSKIIVNKGDRVKKRQVVAYMGMTGTEVTGPHCHFILTLNGNRVNPINYCYIEEWQNVSEKTKKYDVMYKEKEEPKEEAKEELKEEPKEEPKEEIKEEPKEEVSNQKLTFIDYIFDFIRKIINFILRKK